MKTRADRFVALSAVVLLAEIYGGWAHLRSNIWDRQFIGEIDRWNIGPAWATWLWLGAAGFASLLVTYGLVTRRPVRRTSPAAAAVAVALLAYLLGEIPPIPAGD